MHAASMMGHFSNDFGQEGSSQGLQWESTVTRPVSLDLATGVQGAHSKTQRNTTQPTVFNPTLLTYPRLPPYPTLQNHQRSSEKDQVCTLKSLIRLAPTSRRVRWATAVQYTLEVRARPVRADLTRGVQNALDI